MSKVGICKFCGQTMMAEDSETQEKADIYATMHCDCKEGRQFRNIEDMKDTAYANAEALFPLPEGADISEQFNHDGLMRLFNNVITCVAAGIIEKSSIKIDERTSAQIFITAKDGIRIKKNYKEEYVLEANHY